MGIPNELGGLVRTHHPIRPALSIAMCAIPGLLVGAGLAFGAVGSPTIGGILFVLTTMLLIALFAESLFVRQQSFEHGLLLSSIVPWTPRYVIPYASIEPGSIRPAPYRRPAGASDVTDAFNRRYRQAPTVAVVTFVAITPKLARDLAKGRVRWMDAASPVADGPGLGSSARADLEQWFVSFRNNEAEAEQLRGYVHRSTGRSQ